MPRLPPHAAAVADLLLAARRDPWGGPLNGQVRRQETVRELLGLSYSAVVETGTYRGVTTEFLRRCCDVPVYTVEVNRVFYHYARLRLRKDPGIRVVFGDSRKVLRRLAADVAFPKRRVFFYLDAHWGPHLPLVEEMTTIAGGWSEWAVMIDDFEVPDDPGYGFDSYPDGTRLTIGVLPQDVLSSCRIFWPSARSQDETGERRGFVLLVEDGPLAERIAALDSLRPG